MDINLHSRDGIDKRDRIGSAGLNCLCHFPDIRHIGAQLHDDRLSRFFFHGSRDGLSRLCILSESDPAFPYVWTGDRCV